MFYYISTISSRLSSGAVFLFGLLSDTKSGISFRCIYYDKGFSTACSLYDYRDFAADYDCLDLAADLMIGSSTEAMVS